MRWRYRYYWKLFRKHMDVWGYKAIFFSLISGMIIAFFYLKVDENVAVALIVVFYSSLGKWLLNKWEEMKKSR